MTETRRDAETAQAPSAPQSGYAPVNGLQMYYEIHGSGGTPLLLLQHLDVPQADVFGLSVGGGVALHVEIRHPQLVRKVIVSSVSFQPDGDRGENTEAVSAMTVDMIAGTPMEQDYHAKSPHPDRLQDLLDKLGTFDHGFTAWSLQLCGGDVNGDFVGVPASQLAVFPGTTHFFGLTRTDLVRDVVLSFLDAPMPEAGLPQAVLRRISRTVSSGWSQCGKWPQLANQCRVASGNSSAARRAWPGSVTLSLRPQPITTFPCRVPAGAPS